MRLLLSVLVGLLAGSTCFLVASPAPVARIAASSAIFEGDKDALVVFQNPKNSKKPRKFTLWETSQGGPTTTLTWDDQGQRFALTFSRDESKLACRSTEGTIFVWDRRSGAELARYPEEAWKKWKEHRHLPLFFGPRDELLVIGPKWSKEGLEFSIWDVPSGKEWSRFDWDERLTENALDRHGFLITWERGIFRTWHLASCKTGPAFPAKDWDGLDVTITPDGRYLAWVKQERPWEVCVHDSATKTETVLRVEGRTFHFDLSPDGNTLAVDWFPPPSENPFGRILQRWGLTADPVLGATKLFDLNTQAEIAQLNCRDPAFSPDGKRLLGEGPDGIFQIWDLPIRSTILPSLGSGIAASLLAWLCLAGIARARSRRRKGRVDQPVAASQTAP